MAFTLGAAFVVTPWIARNYFVFNELSFAVNQSVGLLAQRVAYNNMSFTENWAAFFLWMPEWDSGFLANRFPQQTLDRLSHFHSNGILQQDARHILEETSGREFRTQQLFTIIQNKIHNDLYHYVATLPVMFTRGFWGTGSYAAFFGTIFIWTTLKRMRATKNDINPFFLVLTILVGCILVQSLVSANFGYINEYILFAQAYAIAYVAGGLEIPHVLKGLFLSREVN